ncbi:hypothetical protein M8C21_018027, partial [Ambrosia artemisiifolia]
MGIKQCCYILYFTLALVALLQPVRSAEGVGEILPSVNETRSLQACEAYNIIDKCWRGKADWENNRQALADCAQGFAKGTYGGKWGDVYTVTSNLDDDVANPKEGTLRFAAAQNRPLWIIFKNDMVINLNQELVNIIIHNINIHDVKVLPGGMIKSNDGPPILRQASDGDTINVAGSSQIWIDHCSLSKSFDGLVDVTLGSTHVTISNCKFTQQSKAILLGADDTHVQDKGMLATVAFNMFTDNVDQRMPRCRFGFFQVVNNNYDRWGTYAIGGSSAPTILCQGNRFLAPDDQIKK